MKFNIRGKQICNFLFSFQNKHEIFNIELFILCKYDSAESIPHTDYNQREYADK